MYSEEQYLPLVKIACIDGELVEFDEEDSDYQEFAIQIGSTPYD